MNSEFIHPNWHVILIHYPLGLLTIGILIELLSLVWTRTGFRAAGRWMILLGALLAIPSATAGIYAFRDVVAAGPTDPNLKWYEVVDRSPWSGAQWEFISDHIWLNSLGAVAFLAVVVAWVAGSDGWRKRSYWPLMAVLLVGIGLLSTGAWHGGELVYRYGTGVETTVPPPTDMPRASSVLTDTEPRQHTHDGATGHTHGQTSAAGTGQEPTASRVQKYIPPLQLHVVLAGLVVAAAVGALGLTMRIWKSPPPPARSLERAERTGPQDRDAPRVVVTTDTSQATAPVVAEAPRVFPGRFWLLAALLAIGTALAGAWSIMRDISAESLRANLDTLREPSHLRLLLHVVFGVGIVVTLFILASLTRFARRHRGLAGVFSAVLLLAVAGQLWLGILMLYDSHEGPLTGFTPRPAASAHASASVSADFP